MAVIPPYSSGAGQAPGLGGPATDAARQARAAAQRAFFEAALGRAQAPSATGRNPEPQVPAAAALKTQAFREPPAPDRIPPPGSIINILV